MSGIIEKIILFITDFIAISLGSIFLLWTKYVSGGLSGVEHHWRQLHPQAEVGPSFFFALQYYLYDALPVITGCWLVLFMFNGLYRPQRYQSRIDEVIAVFRVVTLGCLLFFIATFEMEKPLSLTRAVVFSYWLALIGLVAAGRVGLRSLQRQLLVRGIGRRKAVIVGSADRGVRLLHSLNRSPAQGYDIVGFVQARNESEKPQVADLPVLGGIGQLSEVIAARELEVVLIALESNSHEEIMEIVGAAQGGPVSFCITPDLYDIVAGHVRTNQVYGTPLMDLKSELMPPWEQAIKRGLDVAVALIVLVGLLPLWAAIALAIRLGSKGPVLFKQERVGQGGKPFMILKFRSMVVDAEGSTGPVWVKESDPRVTWVGKVLRTLHLDEVPQCINFLKGDMSLVGPRPERPFFVEEFRRQIPFYMRRFNVKPGLLGWAQAKHEFDMNSKDLVKIARERLEYDLYYIENMSIKLDFKIMFQTIWFVVRGKSTR